MCLMGSLKGKLPPQGAYTKVIPFHPIFLVVCKGSHITPNGSDTYLKNKWNFYMP